jgi:hypothetical protein
VRNYGGRRVAQLLVRVLLESHGERLSEAGVARSPRHGTPDDPRFVLIGVEIHAASFLDLDRPQPVVLFEVVKGW